MGATAKRAPPVQATPFFTQKCKLTEFARPKEGYFIPQPDVPSLVLSAFGAGAVAAEPTAVPPDVRLQM